MCILKKKTQTDMHGLLEDQVMACDKSWYGIYFFSYVSYFLSFIKRPEKELNSFCIYRQLRGIQKASSTSAVFISQSYQYVKQYYFGVDFPELLQFSMCVCVHV